MPGRDKDPYIEKAALLRVVLQGLLEPGDGPAQLCFLSGCYADSFCEGIVVSQQFVHELDLEFRSHLFLQKSKQNVRILCFVPTDCFRDYSFKKVWHLIPGLWGWAYGMKDRPPNHIFFHPL